MGVIDRVSRRFESPHDLAIEMTIIFDDEQTHLQLRSFDALAGEALTA